MSNKPPIFQTTIEAYKFLFKNFLHILYLSRPLLIFPILSIILTFGFSIANSLGLVGNFNFKFKADSFGGILFGLTTFVVVFAIITYIFCYLFFICILFNKLFSIFIKYANNRYRRFRKISKLSHNNKPYGLCFHNFVIFKIYNFFSC